MKRPTFLLGLLLLISSVSFAFDEVTRPKQLKNITCYVYRQWPSAGQPILSELFTLDRMARVHVGGVLGQFVGDSQVLPASVFRTGTHARVTIEDLNGRKLIGGHIYIGTDRRFNDQTVNKVWAAGTLYDPGLEGDILCAPTSYGPPQRLPNTEAAMKFLTSNAVPKELSDFVRQNRDEVQEIVDRRSDLQDLGDDVGETLSDKIILRGIRDEENQYCEKAYVLSFNIFTKKLSVVRGTECPDCLP